MSAMKSQLIRTVEDVMRSRGIDIRDSESFKTIEAEILGTSTTQGGPRDYVSLWEANMPRVSGSMYFAIPGEQPIHVTDDQALRILEMLSREQ